MVQSSSSTNYWDKGIRISKINLLQKNFPMKIHGLSNKIFPSWLIILNEKEKWQNLLITILYPCLNASYVCFLLVLFDILLDISCWICSYFLLNYLIINFIKIKFLVFLYIQHRENVSASCLLQLGFSDMINLNYFQYIDRCSSNWASILKDIL